MYIFIYFNNAYFIVNNYFFIGIYFGIKIRNSVLNR